MVDLDLVLERTKGVADLDLESARLELIPEPLTALHRHGRSMATGQKNTTTSPKGFVLKTCHEPKETNQSDGI